MKKAVLFIFIISFFIINIIQAYITPLLNDEPYYWMYAQHLAWGYFDHPPMVGFLTKAGVLLFKNEFGVRLLFVLLGTANIYLIYKLLCSFVREVNVPLFILLIISSFFINLYSFMALPDTPLLFFSSAFFLAYKQYLQKDSIKNSLLLAFICSLILYSKYQGILIILFTLLSNFTLLKKVRFWVLVIFPSIILFMPHIIWQFKNDFPTVRFHLVERYSQSHIYTLNYVGEQIGITGPLFLLLFAFLYKVKDKLGGALKYTVIGVFIFFLLSSFRGRINVHWTNVAWTPIIVLSYLGINNLKKNIGKRVIYVLLCLNLAGVMVIRVIFATNILEFPNFNDILSKELSAKIYQKANNNKVMFIDMYKEPSYYNFYTGARVGATKKQYKLWHFETQWNDKIFYLISAYAIDSTSQEIILKNDKKYYFTEKKNVQ